MKVKDLVKHVETGRVGFIMCKRDDLKGVYFDVQFSYEYREGKEQDLINQGCFKASELEVIYSV